MEKTVKQLREELDEALSCRGFYILKEVQDKILSIFLDQTKDNCSECGGRGFVQFTPSLDKLCSNCDGTGKVGEWHPERLEVRK